MSLLPGPEALHGGQPDAKLCMFTKKTKVKDKCKISLVSLLLGGKTHKKGQIYLLMSKHTVDKSPSYGPVFDQSIFHQLI